MTFLDFFAGIGGFRKGMEQAGHKCVGFCEFDKFAVASYTSMHLITDEQREYLATAQLEDCLEANVLRFKDGFVLCPILWSGGECNECYEAFERRETE